MSSGYTYIKRNKYSHIVFIDINTLSNNMNGLFTWLDDYECYTYDCKLFNNERVIGPERKNWEKNFTNYHRDSKPLPNPYEYALQFGFLTEEEAILFKMTWC